MNWHQEQTLHFQVILHHLEWKTQQQKQKEQHVLATIIGIREIKMTTCCANTGSKQTALLLVPRRGFCFLFVCLNKVLCLFILPSFNRATNVPSQWGVLPPGILGKSTSHLENYLYHKHLFSGVFRRPSMWSFRLPVWYFFFLSPEAWATGERAPATRQGYKPCSCSQFFIKERNQEMTVGKPKGSF